MIPYLALPAPIFGTKLNSYSWSMFLLPVIVDQGYKILYLRMCTSACTFILDLSRLYSCSIFFPPLWVLFLGGGGAFACLILIAFESLSTYFLVWSFNCLLVLPKTTSVFVFLFFLIAFGWFPEREGRSASFGNKIFFYLKFGHSFILAFFLSPPLHFTFFFFCSWSVLTVSSEWIKIKFSSLSLASLPA